jgi:hypothetical protein
MDMSLQEVLERARPILDNIPEGEAKKLPGPDKWSKVQILGHLVDSAINNIGRIIRAQKTTSLILEGYEQEFWVKSMNYQETSWEDVRALFYLLNGQLLRVIALIPDEVLELKREQHNITPPYYSALPADGIPTLRFWLEDYICHLENHLCQISEDYEPAYFRK